MLDAIVFYTLSTVLIAAGTMVIVSRNPVHSVLYLILALFQTAGLFLLLGAEFLAMLLVIVTVGAVALLILIVVIMLDVDHRALRRGVAATLPAAGLVGVVLVTEFAIVIAAVAGASAPVAAPDRIATTAQLGRVFYTGYAYLLEGLALVLLTALVGAIVLTVRDRDGVRRQDVSAQVGRRRDQVVELRAVASGRGEG